MNIRNKKLLYLSFVIIGAVIWLIFAATNDGSYQSGLLCGMGSSLAVIGAAQLTKLRRLTAAPEKAADYEASCKDERLHFLLDKARSAAFIIGVYVQLGVGLVAQFAFGQKLLCSVLCFIVCFQCLLFVALYYFYARKY